MSKAAARKNAELVAEELRKEREAKERKDKPAEKAAESKTPAKAAPETEELPVWLTNLANRLNSVTDDLIADYRAEHAAVAAAKKPEAESPTDEPADAPVDETTDPVDDPTDEPADEPKPEPKSDEPKPEPDDSKKEPEDPSKWRSGWGWKFRKEYADGKTVWSDPIRSGSAAQDAVDGDPAGYKRVMCWYSEDGQLIREMTRSEKQANAEFFNP